MSHPTQPAFIHNGSWDEKSRANPAIKWMEHFTINEFDTKDYDKCAQATTSDFVYHKADGSIFNGREAAWKQIAQDYAGFADQKHEPFFLLAWETSEGWELMGEVNVFFKLPATLPESATDLGGKKWHGVAFGAYHFKFVKDGGDIKLKYTRIYADQSPVLKLMLKNGMMNGEQLAGMLSS